MGITSVSSRCGTESEGKKRRVAWTGDELARRVQSPSPLPLPLGAQAPSPLLEGKSEEREIWGREEGGRSEVE